MPQEQKSDKPRSSEIKAIEKFPYDIFKEICLSANYVNIATKIKVFDLWFAANENKLKAKDLKGVFKDYREFVDRDVADFTQQFKQQESGSQNYCSFGNFHY